MVLWNNRRKYFFGYNIYEKRAILLTMGCSWAYNDNIFTCAVCWNYYYNILVKSDFVYMNIWWVI